MLNRRILRVKAFQSLYAYSQCKTSNFNLAKDFISASFMPDLNSMEVQDKSQLRRDAEICTELFAKNLNNNRLIAESGHSTKIKSTAIKAVNQYHRSCEKDLDFLRNNMMTAVDDIPQLYLWAIQLLLAFGDHVKSEYERKIKLSKDVLLSTVGELNLAENKVLQYLKSAPQYEAAVIRNRAYLDELEIEIKEWYREYVKPHEDYQAYLKVENPTLKEDNAILQEILKKIVFKTDPIVSFFYEKDLNWAENKPIVRSLALKVLKNVEDNPEPENFALPEIAINWEEDKEFFQNIFNLSVESEEKYKDLIAQKTKNWDIDRLASTDKIIITMALAEMVNFPSIPTKVSINEYIDISKNYSTPKSKQFVNGLLDVLAKELTENGEIRKSGRGLLDNK
ncbi:MAG TPA: transcription antitermination factor NusB [Cyclobacteriaceae bacterium]|nr:transcription antitermination factor NusB [Cyclobacteriaceae bacterium]